MTLLRDRGIAYIEEMRGLAEGAEVDFESVLALNVRTEIAYGMFNDGCTAFSWREGEESFLAQNWDVCRFVHPDSVVGFLCIWLTCPSGIQSRWEMLFQFTSTNQVSRGFI